jgi:hypothetical protein
MKKRFGLPVSSLGLAALLSVGACKGPFTAETNVNGSASDLVLKSSEQDGSLYRSQSESGANLTVKVRGIRVGNKPSQLCYAVNAGNPTAKLSPGYENVVCSIVAPGEKTAVVEIKALPLSAYVMFFHDENSNSKLDMSVVNVLVEKRESIGEGYGFVEDPNSTSENVNARKLLILTPGRNEVSVELTYEASAFQQYLTEKTIKAIVKKAQDVNTTTQINSIFGNRPKEEKRQ